MNTYTHYLTKKNIVINMIKCLTEICIYSMHLFTLIQCIRNITDKI